MTNRSPFLIEHIAHLRQQLLSSHSSDLQHPQAMRLWQLLLNCATTAPKQFPWFTPFVALITQQAEHIEQAKAVLQDYVDKLEPMYFTSGLQYHFWCFAFPHAKWCMYFQWLVTLGAYTSEEETRIREKLLMFQFTNFFYGMRTKPEPECIDNQTLSLVLSNVMVGYICTMNGQSSPLAQLMLDEGLRRLPGIIGGIPASGYTGEGSSYMDCVIAPAIPLVVELMQRITGNQDMFDVEFAPNHVSPRKILAMASREWLPGGLLLPWDNYGYQYGVRAPIAYAAKKTKDPHDLNILQQDAVWSYDIGVGWAYDDLVWTLIWWPNEQLVESASQKHWMHPEIGGILRITQHPFALIHMWDESEPIIPTRSHVNPNAVLLHAYGVPISMDGSVRKDVSRFHFADTWREVIHHVGEVTNYNYGDGCAGAHNVLLVDGWEGLRAMQRYAQFRALELDDQRGAMTTDVTPIYAEHYPDAQLVKRRTSVGADRFFIIEDVAVFTHPHQITSRFILRPEVVDKSQGIMIHTAEGICLQLIDVLGETRIVHERLSGPVYLYPLDQDVEIVDFVGTSARRLFIAWMTRDFQPDHELLDWQVIWDESEQLNLDEARSLLTSSPYRLNLQLPSYMEQPLPIVKRWWYFKQVSKPRSPCWLQLPRGMHQACCWINNEPVEFYNSEWGVLAPVMAIPQQWEQVDTIDIVFRIDVPISHFDGRGEGTVGLNGGCYLCIPCESEQLLDAQYDGTQLVLQTNKQTIKWPYQLLEV
jgi:hypothetical protein